MKALGWGDSHRRHFEQLSTLIDNLVPARVAALERGAVHVLGAGGDPRASAVARDGRFRREGLEALAVGDWVALRATSGDLVVEHVLPRTSYFVRKEVGRRTGAQMVAANVDRVLVVTAIGDDLSPGRIERYLAAIWAGGAEPVVVINKRDRPHDAAEVQSLVEASAPGVRIVRTDTLTDGGTEELSPLLVPGITIALVGSSGVGKTSLLNRLLGGADLATGPVREADDKGRHTTTRRELHPLASGVLVIDTPGMREFGLWDAAAGLSQAFADIEDLAAQCHFADCTHAHEPECAVLSAMEAGVLLPDRLARYHRLAREIAHLDARAAERPSRESKQHIKSVARGMRERNKLNRKFGLKDW